MSALIDFKDRGINALWLPEDDHKVSEEFWQVKMGKVSPDTFEQKLLKKYNDKRSGLKFEKSGKPFEPIYVAKPNFDMVTLNGMNRIGELTTGKLNNRPFTHFAAGTGTTAEKVTDDKLVAEIPLARVSMITDGFAEPAGSSMKFAGKFSVNVQNSVVSEGGVFDGGLAGVMLFRSVYDDDERINHRAGETFFTLTESVSMISVT